MLMTVRGVCVDDEPVVIDGRDPHRDSRPDEDKYQKLGLAHIEYRLDRQSNFSAAKPREKVPRKGPLLARATQNLDTMEYFEDRRIVVGLTTEELAQQLPLTGRRKTCSIRVVLYYDPDYVPVTRAWVTDPDPKHGAKWLKKLPESTNPGIHPGRWFNMN
eukprot:1979581-Pyramimonas_sp.AAC.1